MRKFSSYGPVNAKLHFHAPRKELINRAYTHLVGEIPEEGHYITIWAPRQAGKTWIMQQVAQKIKKNGKFDMAILTMEFARDLRNLEEVMSVFLRQLGNCLGREFSGINLWESLPEIFKNTCLEKPLILISAQILHYLS